MKSCLIIFSFLFNSTLFSQSEDPLMNGKHAIEFNPSLSLSSFNLTPTYVLTFRKKSKFIAGVEINIINNWSFPGVFSSFGLCAGYKFYPNGEFNKVNFYFHTLSKYFLFNLQSYFVGEPKHNHYFESFIGYGFDVPIGKKCYFLHDIGVGGYVSWRTYKTLPTELDWFSLSGYVRIGLGIKLGK